MSDADPLPAIGFERAIDARVLRTALIVFATAASLFVLWRLLDLLLLAFGCALVALILLDFTRWIARRARLGFAIALACAVVLILAGLAGAVWFFGQSLGTEFADLTRRLPGAWAAFETRLGENSIGAAILARARAFAPDGQTIMGTVTTVLASVGAALSGLAVVLVCGIYLAAQPRLYGRGILLLTPPRARTKVAQLLSAMATALNAWLKGQALGMVFVGVATSIGLSIVGVPAAPAIGLIAGLCEFVPYLGTVVVGIPAIILGFAEGTETGLWTIAVLVIVQQIQGSLVMPLIESRMVDLPPALTIFALVAAGLLLGPLGVILATPLTVVAMVLVKSLYLAPADRIAVTATVAK